jgi:hypothetical protein
MICMIALCSKLYLTGAMKTQNDASVTVDGLMLTHWIR